MKSRKSCRARRQVVRKLGNDAAYEMILKKNAESPETPAATASLERLAGNTWCQPMVTLACAAAEQYATRSDSRCTASAAQLSARNKVGRNTGVTRRLKNRCVVLPAALGHGSVQPGAPVIGAGTPAMDAAKRRQARRHQCRCAGAPVSSSPELFFFLRACR